MTNIALKIALSAAIVLIATALAKKFPSSAGLIGVMPLAGALVLSLVYIENRGEPRIMQNYVTGALWGLAPTVIFYIAVFQCIKKGMPLPWVIGAGFAAWLVAAWVHQSILG